jgi:ribonuclease-3
MSETLQAGIAPLRAALGVDVPDDLLILALTHRSFAYENGGLPTNERLEFLGDSVLSIVVTETLYRRFPDLPEGRLAKLRASVVNMRALAGVARTLGPNGVGEFIFLGRGEVVTGGNDKDSILADAVEALLGAVYLGCGPDAAAGLVHRLFDDMIDAAADLGAGQDWKTTLQEHTAANHLGVPTYRISQTGPDHAKVFAATVVLGEQTYGSGTGRTKKDAEQQAAERTVALLVAAVAMAAASAGAESTNLDSLTVET